jgi:hypothetical protein
MAAGGNAAGQRCALDHVPIWRTHQNQKSITKNK